MELSVQINSCRNSANLLEDCSEHIRRIAEQLELMRYSCPFSGASRYSIMNSLRTVTDEIYGAGRGFKVLSGCLELSMNTYNATEQKLSSVSLESSEAETNVRWENIVAEESLGKEELLGKEDVKGLDYQKLIWDTIAEIGLTGGGTAIIEAIINHEMNPEDTLEILKLVNKQVGTGADVIAAGNTSSGWISALFGLDKVLQEKPVSYWDGIKEYLKRQVDDLDIGSKTTASGKTGVVTKWLGHFLTVGINVAENHEEMRRGDISVSRAAAETVLESVVDIGMEVGISAALASALALTPVGASALLVGAGTAVIAWGTNEVCEWLFEKDAGEIMADLVCDVGESVVHLAEEAGKALGDWTNRMRNRVSIAWKSVFG